MLTKAEESGYVLLDTLSTGVPGRGVAERKQAYIEFLKDLQPGVTKLIVHLAWEGPEIQAVTNNWEQRWADYLFWTSPDTKLLLKDLNIRLVTYRELGKLARYSG
jgi:chitin disaccharide deacetylase